LFSSVDSFSFDWKKMGTRVNMWLKIGRIEDYKVFLRIQKRE